MPDAIADKVIQDVATYSRRRTSEVKPTAVLANLGIDHFGFLTLARSLRSFVKFNKPKNTLFTREVEKKGLTVQDLIDLVRERST